MINQHDQNSQIEWRFSEAKRVENWTNMISTPPSTPQKTKQKKPGHMEQTTADKQSKSTS